METLVVVLARVVLGGILALAGWRKLKRSDVFEQALQSYHVRSRSARRLLSKSIPATELFLGLSLIGGVVVIPTAIGAIALLALFTFAGLRFPISDAGCHCFEGLTILETRSRITLGLRNAVLIGIAALVASNHVAMSIEFVLGTMPATGLVLALTMLIAFKGLPGRIRGGDSQIVTEDSLLSDVTMRTSRRSFLGAVMRAGAALGMAGALTRLPGVPRAEAACYGCESCAPEMIWAACYTGCCAAYWVRDREYCSPNCFPCSAWRLVQVCGVSECC